MTDASPPPPPACPSTCAADTVAACALACEEDLPGPIAAGGGIVAWTARTSSGSVLRTVDRVGGPVRSLVTLAAPANALALAGTKPVWIDGASVSTVRQGVLVVLAPQPATGIAAVGDRVFFAVATTGTIDGCAVDACAPAALHTGQSGVTALGAGVVPTTTDVRGAWMASGASPRELRAGGLDPLTPASALVKDEALVERIAVDPADGTKVVAILQAQGTSLLVRHPGAETLAKVTGTLGSIAVAGTDVVAVMNDGMKSRVMRMRDDGTRIIIADDVDAGAAVAIDDLFAYWTARTPTGGRIMRVQR